MLVSKRSALCVVDGAPPSCSHPGHELVLRPRSPPRSWSVSPRPQAALSRSRGGAPVRRCSSQFFRIRRSHLGCCGESAIGQLRNFVARWLRCGFDRTHGARPERQASGGSRATSRGQTGGRLLRWEHHGPRTRGPHSQGIHSGRLSPECVHVCSGCVPKVHAIFAPLSLDPHIPWDRLASAMPGMLGRTEPRFWPRKTVVNVIADARGEREGIGWAGRVTKLSHRRRWPCCIVSASTPQYT